MPLCGNVYHCSTPKKVRTYILTWRERGPYVQQWLHSGKGLIGGDIVRQPVRIRNKFTFFFSGIWKARS